MRLDGLRPVLRQSSHARRLRAAAVDPAPVPRASLLTLIRLTIASVGRHAALYTLTGIVCVAIEAVIIYAWQAKPAQLVADAVVQPLFVIVVTAFSFGDLSGDGAAALWARVLERLWAVLLIDLLVVLIAAFGLGGIIAPDIGSRVLGTGLIVIAISFIFADVYATVADDVPWWLLVPRSFAASMIATWRGLTFTRAMVVFALGDLLPAPIAALAQSYLQSLHVAHADFWSTAVPVMLLLPVVQAFSTFVFLDAIGYTAKHPCGE